MRHEEERWVCEQDGLHDHKTRRSAEECDAQALRRWRAWAQALALRLSKVAEAVNPDDSWRELILNDDPPPPPKED